MRFLRRKDENFLYGWTEALSLKPEFFECDKNGKAVENTPVEEITAPAEPKRVKPQKIAEKPISDMNDVELEDYARKTFNAELDRRLSMDALRKQVRGLISGALTVEQVESGLTEPPIPEPVAEEDPFTPPAADVPEMPETFATKQDAIRWAKDRDLGISFRARDTKAKAIGRIEKRLEELRNE